MPPELQSATALADLIPEKALARQLGYASVRVLWEWRRRRIGPAFIKLGKKIFYRPQAVADFLAKAETRPVREGRQRRRRAA